MGMHTMSRFAVEWVQLVELITFRCFPSELSSCADLNLCMKSTREDFFLPHNLSRLHYWGNLKCFFHIIPTQKRFRIKRENFVVKTEIRQTDFLSWDNKTMSGLIINSQLIFCTLEWSILPEQFNIFFMIRWLWSFLRASCGKLSSEFQLKLNFCVIGWFIWCALTQF